MGGFVYILADFRRGQTYIGVTNDLIRRVYEHREGLVEGYTRRKSIKRLVYFEEHDDIAAAIQRETSLKRWYKHWKWALIEESNPDWRDLWDEVASQVQNPRVKPEGDARWVGARSPIKENGFWGARLHGLVA